MKELIADFKKFISRGNVVDLAVGVMIGAAFQNIVKSFTDGIVTPLLNAIGGQPDVPLAIWHFNVGTVINAVISFLITAAVIFFLIVKPMTKLMEMTKKDEANEAKDAKQSADVKLLGEIRDLLKQQVEPGESTAEPAPRGAATS